MLGPCSRGESWLRPVCKEGLPHGRAGPAAHSPSSQCSAVEPAQQPRQGGGVHAITVVSLVRKQSPGEESEPRVLHPLGWDTCQSASVQRCWVHVLGLESGASDTGARQQGADGGCDILFPGATVATVPAACLQALAAPQMFPDFPLWLWLDCGQSWFLQFSEPVSPAFPEVL